MKDVPLDPATVFDRRKSNAARRTRNRPRSNRPANFRESFRAFFTACFQITAVFRRADRRASRRSDCLTCGESCSRPTSGLEKFASAMMTVMMPANGVLPFRRWSSRKWRTQYKHSQQATRCCHGPPVGHANLSAIALPPDKSLTCLDRLEP
jgi:hypothetical protein